jgi:hypothetical protein
MDTLFWGPDGWKLLHSITENYPNKPTNKDKELYKKFFLSLPYVLPCIYCRNSLADYMKELPLRGNLESRNKLCLWLYRIHNRVNGKLRTQGINRKPNPPYREVRDYYKNYLDTLNKNNCVDAPGWEFLYSIAFNYPIHKKDMVKKRYEAHRIFFTTYPKVTPFKKLQGLLGKNMGIKDAEDALERRSLLKRFLYKIETKAKKHINQKCSSYKLRCVNVEKYRAGCKKITCRKTEKVVK